MYYFVVIHTFEEAADPVEYASTVYYGVRFVIVNKWFAQYIHITKCILINTFMTSFLFGIKGDISF